MTTQIIKTIGTGGDYVDWSAFIAACPTDLVAPDQQWKIKFKKQLHVSSTGFNFSAARTTDATRYFEFTAEDGAAWCDDANVRLNPFILDSTKGATLQMTGSAVGFNCGVNYTKINKLQLQSTNNTLSAQPTLYITSNNTGCSVDKCIIDGYGQNSALPTVLTLKGSHTVSNSLIVQRQSDPAIAIATLTVAAKAYNCLFVSLNVKLNAGIVNATLAGVLENCGVFNVTAPESGPTPATKTTCATDATATGWITVPYSAATFTSITPATPDFRLPAGSALINAGTADASAPIQTDATGIARPYGAAYDIGPWEYAVADTTAPVLSAPAASATSATTASGTVVTNEAGGLLYYMASANATETAATIKAGNSQVVSATGTQNVSITGLSPGTAYYTHFVQVDAAGNTSNVANGTGFSTPSLDTVAPTWPNGAAITPGTITSSSVAFSYPAASDNVAVHHYETSKDGGASWQNNGTGLTGQFSGLASSTAFPIAVSAVDAQNNRSPLITLTMTTAAGASGSLTTLKLFNNSSTPAYAQGTAVVGQWHQGGRVGSAGTSITYVTGTVAADGTVTFTGLPTGAGFLLAAIRGANTAADKPYYQPGTVV